MEQAEIKARELIEKFKEEFELYGVGNVWCKVSAKKQALICVENEYHSLREQLFNLRSCRVIENEKTYLVRLQQLIDDENELKQHLNNL